MAMSGYIYNTQDPNRDPGWYTESSEGQEPPFQGLSLDYWPDLSTEFPFDTPLVQDSYEYETASALPSTLVSSLPYSPLTFNYVA